MGQRGPKSQPTAMKLLRGNPGKRPLNKNEPLPTISDCPNAPDYLDATAKLVWAKLAKELHRIKCLSEVDENAFGLYCMYQGLFIDCCEKLKTEPIIIISNNKQPYQNPLVGIRNKAAEQIKKWSAEFGLTPSARSRLQIETIDSESEIEKELFGFTNGKTKTG
jgi:P27 family predicted phage terminase small subunit